MANRMYKIAALLLFCISANCLDFKDKIAPIDDFGCTPCCGAYPCCWHCPVHPCPVLTCDKFQTGVCTVALSTGVRLCNQCPVRTQVQCKACPFPVPCNKNCQYPVAPGPCNRYSVRYYYEFKTNSCKKFMFGGCVGNPNNFDTLKECQAKCVLSPRECLLQKKPGPCKAYMPNYYYDVGTNSCKLFIYGGCQGNANRFGTIKECQEKCIL